jgi:hypothetical protein
MDDVTLLTRHSEVRPAKDLDTTHAIQYLCNLAFPESLVEPCANTKFPGSLVVSLSRQDVQKIRGTCPVHRPYKEAHILAWMTPMERHIPTVSIMESARRTQKSYQRSKHARHSQASSSTLPALHPQLVDALVSDKYRCCQGSFRALSDSQRASLGHGFW